MKNGDFCQFFPNFKILFKYHVIVLNHVIVQNPASFELLRGIWTEFRNLEKLTKITIFYYFRGFEKILKKSLFHQKKSPSSILWVPFAPFNLCIPFVHSLHIILHKKQLCHIFGKRFWQHHISQAQIYYHDMNQLGYMIFIYIYACNTWYEPKPFKPVKFFCLFCILYHAQSNT